ncbi:hypothetical protein Nepgr_011826 [Nepenthes gracilis]|uniref:Uncharacterized protein n=1 Tax=Nepenthes gracilis TaxID=150966 RepID=A0AAD3SFT2_NEPGR|nr:hypothetical protein Nepgr_011826 [Nepenthes gracilis]
MEENFSSLKRWNSEPSLVEIPSKVRSQRRSPAAFVHDHHQSSSSPSPLSTFSGVDFDLLSLMSPTYISLRDLLTTSPPIISPTVTATAATISSSSGGSAFAAFFLSGYEISIRNHLRKSASSAYFQPMSSSPNASWSQLWRCFSGDFFMPLFASVNRWIVNIVTRVSNWLVAELSLIFCR